MLGRLLRSPSLSLFLFVALLASIAAHAVRSRDDRAVNVVSITTEGPDVHPEVRIDFDAEMVAEDRVGKPVAAGLVSLSPAVAVDA